MNELRLIKKIEAQATRFKSRALKSPNDRKRHDQVRQDEQKYMRIACNQLGWSFTKIGSVFDRDWRTTKQAIESYERNHPAAQQKPYEETPHKRKMRELAKVLAGKISLPSLWDKDLWRDLPLESQPGKYSLPIGAVEISGDKQIKVNYYDVSANFAAPHLVKGLYGHLHTSGLSKFAELVGDKGKLDNWVGAVGQYSEALMTFLKVIADEVKGYRAKVTFHDEAKPSLTKWFIVIAWNDALQKATGYSWIDDSWYKPPENIPNTSLWKLNCGAYAIGIARSKRTLKTYEKWHKNLRVKYAEHRLAKNLAARSRKLSNIAQEIGQRLQEFSDMQHVPGHCELC